MKKLFGYLIGALVLVGTLMGETGESIEQIINKQGPVIKITNELLLSDENHNNTQGIDKDIISVVNDIRTQFKELDGYFVKNPKNFDSKIYFFIKQKDSRLKKCVLSIYIKFYNPRQISNIKDHEDPNYFPEQLKYPSLQEVKRMLNNKSTNSSTISKTLFSENIKDGVGYVPWHICWLNSSNEIIDATVGDSGKRGYLKLICISKELIELSENIIKHTQKNSLPEGIWDIPDNNANLFTETTKDYKRKIFNILSRLNETAIQIKNNTAKEFQEAIDRAENINPFRFSIGKESDFETQQINDGVLITKYSGNTVDLIIPDKINGVNVVEVGHEAFKKQPIRSIRLPVYLKRIAPKAFFMCNDLQSVLFNEQIEEIGNSAFAWCGLTEVIIPGSVKKYGAGVFASNTQLIKAEVLEPFKGGEGLFSHCYKLKNVQLPESMTNISSNAFESCAALKELKIPDSVVSIGDLAFCASGIENIPWPKKLERIGISAFASCYGLRKVQIPLGIKEINGLFTCCRNLEEVILPETLQIIGSHSFRECEKLEAVTFQGTTISEWAFSQTGVKKVMLKKCQYIGKGAFSHCTNLVSVNFGNQIKKIDANAFTDCSKLTNISLPASLEEVNEKAFDSVHLSEVIKQWKQRKGGQ